MGNDAEPGGPPLRGASGDTFAALLDRLKRRGTSVLVVGDLSADVERAMSRRMMGHPEEPRDRLLVALRPTDDGDDWFPGPVTADDERTDVLDLAGVARAAAPAEEPGTAVAAGPPRADALVDRVTDWVEATARTEESDPGQLRVGVPSLDVLLESDGAAAPRRAAEALHGLMRDHQGVAHLYVPRERSSRVVQQTTVWVDVVVEVRTDRGRPEQRWVVQDTVETSWFPIRDDEPDDRA